MRRVLLLVLFAVVMSVPAAGAGKITSDPNAPGAAVPKSAPIDKTDKRLETKVTYEARQKRLHTITDDLSKMTGVTIRSGKNTQDWQTRDLPLTICVKDMPLVKLLNALCDAAHLKLSWEQTKTGKSDSRTYRLLSDNKYQEQLDVYNAAFRQYRSALNSWAWDTLIKAGKIPDLENAIQQNQRAYGFCDPQLIRAVSGVLAELGPKAKEKLISGRRIDISLSAFPDPDALFKLFQLGYNKNKPKDAPEPQMSDMDMSTLSLTPGTVTDLGWSSPSISITSIQYTLPTDSTVSLNRSSTSWHEDLTSIAEPLYEKLDGKNLPPKPEDFKIQRPSDSINTNLTALSQEPDLSAYTSRTPGEPLKVYRDGKLVEGTPEWQSSLLRKKVKLELPSDRDLTYADVLIALAKSAETNIVTEDFVSHKNKICFQPDGSTEYLNPVKEYNGRETTLGDILGDIVLSPQRDGNFAFYFCNDENLIVGRAYDWFSSHKNLLPEALVADLQIKANNNGLDIDDVVQLIQCTSGQHQDWLAVSPDLSMLTSMPNNSSRNLDDIFWRFYAGLTPQDKAQAKADTGLQLAKFVSNGCCDFFLTEREMDSTIYERNYNSANDKLQADNKEQSKFYTLTNLDILRNLSLYIRTKPLSQWSTYSSTGTFSSVSSTTKIPDYAKDRHTYAATIEGYADGKPVKIEFKELRSAFPVYSPAKEKQLKEQWKKEHNK